MIQTHGSSRIGPMIEDATTSIVGSVVGRSRLIGLDRALLILTSVFLLSHAGALYVSTHGDGFDVIIENLLLIVVGSVVSIAVLVRIIIFVLVGLFRQRWLMSPALPACILLLAIYPFVGPVAVFYVIDQLRFHINKSSYVTKVEESHSSPKFVIFDWGSSGFVASHTNYFLVFDENGSIARGLADPMDMPLPSEPTKCSTSVLQLYGSFYSVAVNCSLT